MLSSTFIDEAKSCVSGAKSLAKVSNVTYTCNGSQLTVYSEGVMSLLESACKNLKSIDGKLAGYSKIMSSGPDELAEIDRNQKNKVTNWAERLKYIAGKYISHKTKTVAAAITIVTIGPDASIVSILNDWFSSRKKKTGTVTETEDSEIPAETSDKGTVAEQEQAVSDDYNSIIDEYDWDKTDVSRDEAEKVVIAALASVPAGQDAREYVKERVDAYYKEHYNKYENPTAEITDQMRQELWDYLMSIINNEIVVAAFLGNLEFESNGLRSMRKEGYSCYSEITQAEIDYTNEADSGSISWANDGKGYGLAQWTWYTRKQGLQNYAKEHNGSVGNFYVQMEYLTTESEFIKTINAVKNETNLEAATRTVMNVYENPNAQYAHYENRYANAQKWLEKYGNH